MGKISIPVGEENFELLRKKKSYYVDKTGLIAELMEDDFKVSLITRPRRFGKTLNMSMLEAFFDINRDNREIFEGLEIMKHEEICAEWMSMVNLRGCCQGEASGQFLTEDSNYHFENAAEEDFWSILYFTGYLTIDRDAADCSQGQDI